MAGIRWLDWCIAIDSHTEPIENLPPGARYADLFEALRRAQGA